VLPLVPQAADLPLPQLYVNCVGICKRFDRAISAKGAVSDPKHPSQPVSEPALYWCVWPVRFTELCCCGGARIVVLRVSEVVSYRA